MDNSCVSLLIYLQVLIFPLLSTLREECPYSEFSWFVFSGIFLSAVFSPNVEKNGPEKLTFTEEILNGKLHFMSNAFYPFFSKFAPKKTKFPI